jgi:hypothetical protein
MFGVILALSTASIQIHDALYFSSALGKGDLVDSAGYNHKTPLPGGHIHSEAVHVQERFSPP